MSHFANRVAALTLIELAITLEEAMTPTRAAKRETGCSHGREII